MADADAELSKLICGIKVCARRILIKIKIIKEVGTMEMVLPRNHVELEQEEMMSCFLEKKSVKSENYKNTAYIFWERHFCS